MKVFTLFLVEKQIYLPYFPDEWPGDGISGGDSASSSFEACLSFSISEISTC